VPVSPGGPPGMGEHHAPNRVKRNGLRCLLPMIVKPVACPAAHPGFAPRRDGSGVIQPSTARRILFPPTPWSWNRVEDCFGWRVVCVRVSATRYFPAPQGARAARQPRVRAEWAAQNRPERATPCAAARLAQAGSSRTSDGWSKTMSRSAGLRRPPRVRDGERS